MLPRLFRSLIAFAAVVVAYQAYAIVAVPLLEPPLSARPGPRATDDQRALAARSVSKYQRLLSHYFPPDHWSQLRPPMVLGNWPALLAIDGYTRHDDGRVDINQFALLVFPTPIEGDAEPPRDAIVLEAPHGATLKFDENFRIERGQIGQIVGGEFPGRIIIRSDMHEPGPGDDLFIETSDLKMNAKRLYTNRPVQFRLGQSVGGGRELEIRFLEEDAKRGLAIAGLDALEIGYDARVRVMLESAGLLSGQAPAAGARAENAQEVAGESPIDVTCSGPFHFDFVRYIASFDRDVLVRQVNPTGPSDQLNARQLDIHFAPKEKVGKVQSLETRVEGQIAPTLDTGLATLEAPRPDHDLGRLEPVKIVAQGGPVTVTSPAHEAEARGERIEIGLRDRRIALAGGRETVLVYGPNVLRAPSIEYWHPAASAGTNVGLFRATGPGSLYYVLKGEMLRSDRPGDAPGGAFQAAWQTSVELGRFKGQPVLTLIGRPQLGVANVGGLTADKISVSFRELDGQASAAGVRLPSAGIPALDGGEADRPARNNSQSPYGAGRTEAAESGTVLIPDVLAASGRVEVVSPALSARTEELQAAFRWQAAGPAGDDADLEDRPEGVAGRLQPGSGAPRSAYHVESDRLQLSVLLHGRSIAPATVECQGNVVFREIPLVPTKEQPLEIRGGQLTAGGLNAGSARVTILGTAPGEPPGSKPAQLAGRGITFFTTAVEVDERANRMWADGPGRAEILVARDLAGGQAPAPYPLEVSWRGGMEFDGRQAVFRGGIEGQGADEALRCEQLTARLTAPVEFGRGIDQKASDIAEIEFAGEVLIDHHSRDERGPTSHDRLQLARLSINQVTGAISGEGPGVIRSTRLNKKEEEAVNPGRLNPLLPASRSGLTFLRVDFDGRLAGNLYIKEVAFNRRVRAVYGPVDSWQQELDGGRTDPLPPDSFTLTCDELGANEDSVAARAASPNDALGGSFGPMQLRATGNVRIDGQSPSGGLFHVEAHRASYEQAKELFSLEGDGRTPTTIRQQSRPGEPSNELRFDWFRYSPATGQILDSKLHGGQFTPPTGPVR
jgi:hypothetical protein